MSAIHFIQRDPKFRPGPEDPKNPSLRTSGFWAVSEPAAQKLIGGMIYFHERKDSRSKSGGEIVGYEVTKEGKYAGRIIFRFREDPLARGKLTGREGWAMEKKIAWDDENGAHESNNKPHE